MNDKAKHEALFFGPEMLTDIYNMADTVVKVTVEEIEKRWGVPPILAAHLLVGSMIGASESAEAKVGETAANPDYEFEIWRAHKAGEFARLFALDDFEQMSVVIDEINAEQTKRFGDVSEQIRNVGHSEYRDRVAKQKGELPDDC